VCEGEGARAKERARSKQGRGRLPHRRRLVLREHAPAPCRVSAADRQRDEREDANRDRERPEEGAQVLLRAQQPPVFPRLMPRRLLA